MDNERRLEDGKLVLFTRNGIWQARIPIGKRRYLWKSLNTSNAANAERAARKLFYQTERKLEEGLPVRSRLFSDVIEEYVAYRQKDHDLGKTAKRTAGIKHTSEAMLRQVKRVAKFWDEYAGAQSVELIDDKALRDYIPWRRTYYHGKEDLHPNAKLTPTDKTLQWDIMLGKALLKYAHEQGYRGSKPLPTFAFTPKIKRVRPHFTAAEFKKMRSGLRAWIDETDNEQWRASRWLLHDYVHTLGMSGIRVGEANSLRVRDVEAVTDIEGRQTIQLHVRGKTGTRTVQPHIELKPIIDALLQRRGEAKPNDLLFVMPDGSPIITLIDQFNTFLKFLSLTHNAAGERYTLYSLRHYYAVRSLGRADIYAVAQNMGTSVAMIEQYYGKHGISPERARKLGGEQGDAERADDPIARLRKSKPTPTEIQHTAACIVAYAKWLKAQAQPPLSSVQRRNAIRAILEIGGRSTHFQTVQEIEGLSYRAMPKLSNGDGLEELFAQLAKQR